MIKVVNKDLNESYYYIKHKSGLPIYVYPKAGYKSTYAIFGTQYGSVNTSFKANAEEFNVPDGIAHYLEHKLFESEDGDAFSKFAKTGASANAFTSFDQTCYLFSCTDNFEEALTILTEFVQEPFFTEESIKKEQGIIGQEIQMYDDDPNWKSLFNLLRCMYHNHPVKNDIAGTKESIAKITPKDLYDCYNAYYNPHNMVLCVVGNVDVDTVLRVADKTLNPKPPVSIENIFPDEPEQLKTDFIKESFSVSTTMFEIGFKEAVTGKRASTTDVVCTDLILDIFASRRSDLYNDLLRQNLINTASFGCEFFEGSGFACILFSGETSDAQKVCDIIKSYANKLHESGIDKEELELARKALYGKNISAFDSIEAIVIGLINGHFTGVKPFDYINELKKVDVNTINEVLKRKLLTDNMCLSVVEPIK